MKKKTYVKPVLNSEEFVPQEYIAACGDQNVVYKFKCTAGGGTHGDVFVDTNHNGFLDSRDENLTPGRSRYFHACKKTHEAPTTDEFLNGFFVPNGGNDRIKSKFGRPYDVQSVIIWTNNGTNVHATEALDRNSWETAKS